MKRVVYIKNTYCVNNKYVLISKYNGFGIYKEKAPDGCFISQSWLVANDENIRLIIQSYNNYCIEEVLDIIDNYEETGKFGIRTIKRDGYLLMHYSGDLI